MLPCCDAVAVAVVADFANVKRYYCLQKKMVPIEAPTRQGGDCAVKDCQRRHLCISFVCWKVKPGVRIDRSPSAGKRGSPGIEVNPRLR